MTLRVLVLTNRTADDRKTLAMVRALARRGHAVSVGTDEPGAAALRARGVARRIVRPDSLSALRAGEPGLAALYDFAAHDVVLPADDLWTAFVAARAATGEAGFPATAVPPPDVLQALHDKQGLADLCRRLGLPHPETRAAGGLREAHEAASAIGFPCIVKPRRGAGGDGVARIDGPAALDAYFAGVGEDRAGDILVQRYLPGATHDVCCVFVRGQPRAAMTQVRLETVPPAGGPGVRVRWTDEPDLRRLACDLLSAAGWHGAAQVECRRDPDGRPWIVEVNGRVWGTLDLAIACGVDVPSMLVDIARTGDTGIVERHCVGRTFSWLYGRHPLHALRFRLRGDLCDFRLADPFPHLAGGRGLTGSTGGGH